MTNTAENEAPFGWAPLVTALLLVVVPAGAVIAQLLFGAFSQWGIAGGTVLHFPTILSFVAAARPGHFESLIQQVGRAMIVAVVDVILATPAAHFLVRHVREKRRLALLVTLLLPFFINSATKAFSWTVALGSQGPLGQLISLLHGNDSLQHALLHNSFAVLLSLVSSSLPLVLFAVTAFMSAIPESVWTLCDEIGIEAGDELLIVALPLAKAGVLAGWIAGFLVCALASFEIDFSGGWHSSLTRANQGFFDERNPNAAMAMGVLFACVCAAIIGGLLALSNLFGRLRVVGRLCRRRRWELFEACCLGVSFLVVLAPTVTILAQTVPVVFGAIAGSNDRLSDLMDDRIIESLEHTITVALAVSIAAGAGAVISALLFWDGKRFQRMLIVSLCLAAIPGDSYAMGVFYLSSTLHLSPSPAILIAASQITWVFPFVLLTVASGYLRLDRALLEAAWDLGTSRWRAFVSLLIPECWPEMILAVVVGAVLSINDSSRASILSDRFQLMSEYIAAELISGTKPSDYLLASFSILLGIAVISGFLFCVYRFHLPEAITNSRIITVTEVTQKDRAASSAS
jgi:ABC-type spermidine/putrescine transport system permease subunit I